MRKSWMAVVLVVLAGCGSSAVDKQATSAYQTAVSSCGSDDQAHGDALNALRRLQRAHPHDATVADAFVKAYRYEAANGC